MNPSERENRLRGVNHGVLSAGRNGREPGTYGL